MAKPKHGRWNNYARQAKLSSRSRSRPCLPRFPSPAVLSALAVIATASSVVAGSPVPTPPPTFLCPFIERDTVARSDIFALPPPPTLTPAPSRTPSLVNTKRELVADKYVEGSDSLWRKTNAWTLYGSTCCSSSTAATSSAIPSQPGPSQTPMSTPSPPPPPPTSTSTVSSTVSFDTSSLPAGWNAASTSNSNTESTIILALAIVLAGSICVFMIGCLVWRRRKKKAKDVERKLGQKLNAGDDSPDDVREKDARGKMRMWAKASARWKSNIRQSARRRRKKPLCSSIANGPLSPSDSQVSVIAPSVAPHSGSLAAEGPADGISLPDVPRVPSRPASPPTYGASLAPRFSGLTPSSTVSDPSSTLPPAHPHPTECSIPPSIIEDEPLPYIPPSDGHVAVDDKAQLARIRGLASSPPTLLRSSSASTMREVSAPEWHEVDDELENLGVDLSQVPMSIQPLTPPPSFPPPPSKADVRFGYFDDHPLHYGESDHILVPLSAPGHSESLFETSPSAPPIDYPDLEPSAPALEGGDDIFQDWDGSSCHISEDSTSAVQDSTPAVPSISSSRPAFSPPRQSAARDSILPQYYP